MPSETSDSSVLLNDLDKYGLSKISRVDVDV